MNPPLPSPAQFARALAQYRAQWGNDGYHASGPRFIRTYELLRRHYTGGTIVDVGAWPGDFACTLASLELPVCVIDKNPARKTAKVLDPATGAYVLDGPVSLTDKCEHYGIQQTRCDIERESLPWEGQRVSMLLCTEVVSHLRLGLLHALREFRRVLTTDGRLLLTTPHMASLTNRLSLLLNRSAYEGLGLPYDVLDAEERIGHSGMYRLFLMHEVQDLLRRTGFEIVDAGYWHLVRDEPVRLTRDSVQRAVLNALSRRVAPFGNALYVVARPAVIHD